MKPIDKKKYHAILLHKFTSLKTNDEKVLYVKSHIR